MSSSSNNAHYFEPPPETEQRLPCRLVGTHFVDDSSWDFYPISPSKYQHAKDIGGVYYENFLSDIAEQYVLSQQERLQPRLKYAFSIICLVADTDGTICSFQVIVEATITANAILQCPQADTT